MPGTFIYNKYVTGRHFVGRKNDLAILQNMLQQGENIAIYEPPMTGKRSLVQQAFYNMHIATQRFTIAETSFLNVRTVADLVMRLGSDIINAATGSPEEYPRMVEELLAGTHFVHDEQVYMKRGTILSLNWDIDDNDIRAITSLPYRIARAKGTKIYVYISEFQNVMLTEDGDRVCRIMEETFKSRSTEDRAAACFIFCGSQVNAMKEIFEHRHWFYRQYEHLRISGIDTKDIIDYTVKNFLNDGKVIERELMTGVCKLFRNNIWYINHFCAICNSLSRGYMMEPILVEALESMIAIHEPRFISIMGDLTTFQVCLLKAIVDGHSRFSSADVIRHYSLNSSANVRRLKDALCKKEIVTFNEDDEPVILDPLFEYWIRKYYFEIKA